MIVKAAYAKAQGANFTSSETDILQAESGNRLRLFAPKILHDPAIDINSSVTYPDMLTAILEILFLWNCGLIAERILLMDFFVQTKVFRSTTTKDSLRRSATAGPCAFWLQSG